MYTSAKVGLILAVTLAYAIPTKAALSQQSYRMIGELTVTIQTNVQKHLIEVLRDGSTVKLTEIVQAEETNYYAVVYLCTSNLVVNFSQWGKDLTGIHRINKASNNGQIEISNYRMPSFATLASVWPMIQGREKFGQAMSQPRKSLFYELPRTSLHEHPNVIPLATGEKYWEAGFSQYAERYTNFDRTLIRQTSFSIQSWTNLSGVIFPKSFAGSDNLWNVQFEFLATEIEELHTPIDTRLPFQSIVTDWRPMEDGRLKTGCSYSITNGIVYADILKEAKEHGIDYGTAHDWDQSHPMQIGAIAPDFSVQDLEGKILKLSELRGKFVLLNFWSTTCGPCIEEMPILKKTYDRFRNDKRFVMIGMALDEDATKVRKFVKHTGIGWPQVLLSKEFDDATALKYRIEGIPTVFIIGPDGKILDQPCDEFSERMSALLQVSLPKKINN